MGRHRKGWRRDRNGWGRIGRHGKDGKGMEGQVKRWGKGWKRIGKDRKKDGERDREERG